MWSYSFQSSFKVKFYSLVILDLLSKDNDDYNTVSMQLNILWQINCRKLAIYANDNSLYINDSKPYN